MKIVYRDWEPDKGFEEIQAKIYNECNPAPQPTTAESIIDRNKQEKPAFCRYALTENGEPLAYVQARDYPQIEETHLGYPWALKNCPKEVQDKLFEAMVEDVKNRKESMTIRANAAANREEIVEFFKKKGLNEKSRSYRYDVDLKALSNSKYSNKDFKTRVAVTDDINELIKLLKEDGRFTGQFQKDEDYANYFKNRVFKDPGHCVMVFNKERLVMASAPLVFEIPQDKERLILRFHSFIKENEMAYEPLITEIAKECVNSDYGTNKPLSLFIGPRDSTFAEIAKKFDPSIEVTGFSFGLEE